MSTLCIDIGSYSVKFLECELGKKNFSIFSYREIPLKQVAAQFGSDATNEDLQLSIVKTYLEEGHDGKVLMQVPAKMVTSRYLRLPITNRKKAEMMVPFQLDENLPFPMSTAHHTMSLRKRSEGFDALVTVLKTNEFERFHEKLEKLEIIPNVLAAELGYIDAFSRVHAQNHPYAIIDIGHTTTKGYFINGHEVVSNHVSHIAGRQIDDMIAKTYNISLNEAVAYKQANAFFLTEGQYQEVTAEQREFADLMRQTIWPLVNELRRWELGFRVKYGQSVETIYLCGGSSRINNIANFISQAVGVRVEILDFTPWVHAQEEHFEEEALSFSNTNFMALSQLDREALPNFLTGAFANSMAGQIPLYSTSFLTVRVAMVCFILLSFMLVERFVFLQKEAKTLDAEVVRLLKTPALALPITQRRYYPSQPQRIVEAVRKKNSELEQEVSLIQAATSRSGVSPLVRLSQSLIGHDKAKVLFFEANDGQARLVLSADNEENLERARASIAAAKLPAFHFGPGKNSNEFSINFEYE
jgi:general secretion pathway protein L